MALHFVAKDPSALLLEFKARVSDKKHPHPIDAWKWNEAGKFFTHVAAQLQEEAVATASVSTLVEKPCLSFYIRPAKDGKISPKGATSAHVYSEMHGNLLATFVKHLRSHFSEAVFTPPDPK